MTTKTAKRPNAKPAESPQVGELTWEAVRWAAEIYWPGLGGKTVQQLEEWNRDLFDGTVRPAPVVLTRMSSIHGHWFPLIDSSQARGTESGLARVDAYRPPQLITSISRSALLRGMMSRVRENEPNGRGRDTPEYCRLVMALHKRLTGKTIWASPEYEKTIPQENLGGGTYRPEHRIRVQDPCPETGQPSITRSEITSWPGTLMDLGHIVKTN